MISARSATLLADGRVLVDGGAGLNNITSYPAELYDPRTGTFAETGTMTLPRLKPTAILMPDGRVLLIGGRDYVASVSGQPFGAPEAYDPATGTFAPLPWDWAKTNLLTTATQLSDGRILALFADREPAVVDALTGRATSAGPLPLAQADGVSATALADGRVLLVVPGDTPQAEVFDPRTLTP